ncbi:SDR family NAD(P)-dependent oxidoreductase [Pseudarthrobacter sp. NPDC058196]|uniref:SDR family NAD(P)-dependent oxidoreductase n=1 Tax=Pseudarthrobacter sp. NPDC058196 TaxID=3346376 RepID=UPI0036DE83B3
MGTLEGKVVLVTGGGGGMGSVSASLFAAEGAKVVVVDNSAERARQTADTIKRDGGLAVDIQADTSSETDWTRVVDGTLGRFDRIDGLANFAAVHSAAGLEATSLTAWQLTLDVNLTGTWLGMRAVVPVMRRQKSGSIVNVGSIDALVGSGSKSAYHAAKGGVRLLSRSAAREYAPHGVRVNLVHPGPMENRMHEAATPKMAAKERAAFEVQARAEIPLGQLGRPIDVAYAVRYLLSDESAYITGIDLPVDGGLTA